MDVCLDGAGWIAVTVIVLGSIVAAYSFKFNWVKDMRINGNSRKILANYLELKKRKLGKLPPVFPNGWFVLLESPQLKKGQVKYVTALGENFAVFRTENGKVFILDAYCPHLGANMAEGGHVRGDCLECPFHGWQFRGDNGSCESIPYAEKVPRVAKVRTWESCEVNNLIFVWYHAELKEPDWHPQPQKYVTNGHWWYQGRNEFLISCHVQEIPENGADFAHLGAVHGPAMFLKSNVPWFARHSWTNASWAPHKSFLSEQNEINDKSSRNSDIQRSSSVNNLSGKQSDQKTNSRKSSEERASKNKNENKVRKNTPCERSSRNEFEEATLRRQEVRCALKTDDEVELSGNQHENLDLKAACKNRTAEDHKGDEMLGKMLRTSESSEDFENLTLKKEASINECKRLTSETESRAKHLKIGTENLSNDKFQGEVGNSDDNKDQKERGSTKMHKEDKEEDEHRGAQDTKSEGTEEQVKHRAIMILRHSLVFLERFTFLTLDVRVQQIGPGYVELMIETSLGPMCIFQTVTPVEPLLQRVVHLIYSPPLIGPYASLVFLGECIMFERDVAIWNAKKFESKPILVKEDRTILAYRRWYSQFYSENSPTYQNAIKSINW